MHEREHADTQTPREFLLLATRLVLERFPEHPEVTKGLLTDITTGSWGACAKRGERIQDGIGWTLSFERTVNGPANEIYEDLWQATAHRPGWQLVLRRSTADATRATKRVWSEAGATGP